MNFTETTKPDQPMAPEKNNAVSGRLEAFVRLFFDEHNDLDLYTIIVHQPQNMNEV